VDEKFGKNTKGQFSRRVSGGRHASSRLETGGPKKTASPQTVYRATKTHGNCYKQYNGTKREKPNGKRLQHELTKVKGYRSNKTGPRV